MHISQGIPLVTNKHVKSFVDITKENNKSSIYPDHYEEKFRILSKNDFKNIPWKPTTNLSVEVSKGRAEGDCEAIAGE